jgi:arylsulfatase A-like enzyme
MVKPNLPISLSWVLLQFISVVPASIFISWLLRNKFDVIQNQITIWVWLYGSFVIIAIPLVGYHVVLEKNKWLMPQEQIYISEPDIKRPNIILLTFDSLTTKDMSVYGYHRPTTPYISEWAKKASLFTGLKAASNYTSTAFPSLYTGKRAWTHRVFQPHGVNVNSKSENFVKLLKQNGYYNMANVTIMSIKQMGFGDYFDIIATKNYFYINLNFIEHIDTILYRFFGDKFLLYNWIIRTEHKSEFIFGKLLLFINKELGVGKKKEGIYGLEKVFNKFIHDLDSNPPEPYFAHLHISHPHYPYYVAFKQYLGIFGPVVAQGGEHTLISIRDRYDETIRSCDEQFKDFISKLAKRDRLKDTVIILSSDHGEMFEEYKIGHGEYYLNEAQTNVPLIIKIHERDEGRVIDDIVEQIDIPVTILDLANIPIPVWMEGRSLVPLIRGKSLSEKPAFSMNFEKNKSMDLITKGVVAVWEGNYKLIHYLEDEKSLLFHLKDDPEELKNLFDKEPEIGQHLLKLIHDNLKEANERYSRGQ